MTKKTVTLLLLVLGISSCNSDQSINRSVIQAETNELVSNDTTKTTVTLCGHCGEIKGSDKCCVADAPKCDKCGLIKGSPGCCKITTDTEICTKCGEIAGSEKCCKTNIEICSKCGLHKGSPGCCKLKI